MIASGYGSVMVLVNGLEPHPFAYKATALPLELNQHIWRTAWTRTTIRRLTAFRNDLYTLTQIKKATVAT